MAKTRMKDAIDLQGILSGPVDALSAAELAEAIQRLEERQAQAKAFWAKLEAAIKEQAVAALGSAEGMQKLEQLREQAAPARKQLDLLGDMLEGARTLHAKKVHEERERTIGAARGELERELGERAATAAEIERLIHRLADKLQTFNAQGIAAFEAARAKLSGNSAMGFRMTGNTGQGLQAFTAQHEANMCLASLSGRCWVYDRMPPTRGVHGFAQMANAWHLQILNDFEERFSREHPELANASEVTS